MNIHIREELRDLLIPLDDIRPNPDNPNNGDVDGVMESIQVNGYLAPIIVDHATGMIVAGHTRYHAMLALGQTHIPGLRVGFDPTRKGAERYMIAENRTGWLARMDKRQELMVLEQLKNTDLGLLGTGFSSEDYEQLLMESAMPDLPPEGHGFGGPAPNGIYQVVIEFDNETDMEAAAADLEDAYDNVRTVRL